MSLWRPQNEAIRFLTFNTLIPDWKLYLGTVLGSWVNEKCIINETKSEITRIVSMFPYLIAPHYNKQSDNKDINCKKIQ